MGPSIFFFRLLGATTFFLLIAAASHSQVKQTSSGKDSYQCIPCGHECDAAIHNQPGKCSQCQMPLVKQSTIIHKTIKPSAICNYLKKNPEVILLDVRTKEEFEGKASPDYGTLQNAINIPIDKLESMLSSISRLKNKEIIVFCSHSHRSSRASYILTSNGFTNVTNMAGGMSVMKDSACKKR
jgi:rhodanese-related sulfurtransferase